MIFFKIMLADRLPQFKKPKAVGIMGFSISYCPVAGFPDAFRGIEIRFTNFKVNDVFSSPLHFLGFFQDIHDDER
jgi:hypothetical protein